MVDANQRPVLTSAEIVALHDEMQNILDNADKGWLKIVSSEVKMQKATTPPA